MELVKLRAVNLEAIGGKGQEEYRPENKLNQYVQTKRFVTVHEEEGKGIDSESEKKITSPEDNSEADQAGQEGEKEMKHVHIKEKKSIVAGAAPRRWRLGPAVVIKSLPMLARRGKKKLPEILDHQQQNTSSSVLPRTRVATYTKAKGVSHNYKLML